MDDDKLILYYYDELSGADRLTLEKALGADPALAARYRELEQQMSGLVDNAAPAVPTHLTERWHDTIERAARAESRAAAKHGSGFNLGSFFWGAALTASLVIGIAIGVGISGGGTPGPTPPERIVETTPSLPTVIPAAFSRGLQVHLRDSRRDISALSSQSAAERSLLIMDILEQNRLFERAAEQKNSPNLARVLRAFEPILIRLAAEDIAPEDAEALRAQLAFELNVMLTKLTHRTSEEPQTI